MNITERMNKLTQGINANAKELAQSVREGALTIEEAAKCHCGHDAKLRIELSAPGRVTESHARLLIQQALSGQL